MNERQKKFAELYAQSGNTVQSAIGAGYSENYAIGRGYELLENVGIKQYIQELTAKEQKKRILTAAERQAILTEIAVNEREKPQDRIKAIDTLNKMTGEYITKIEGSMTAEINPFKGLTTEELKKLAGE